MVHLRVNIFNTSSNLPLLAAQANGCFAARGIEVEFQNTPNSDEQRAGLAAGQFEIAHAAVDNAVAMVESAGTGSLIKQGTGTLIMDSVMGHTGGTTVSAGILQGDAGVGINGTIINNAQVNITRALIGARKEMGLL